MKYSVDTSALLQPWLNYYPPDLFPSFWEKLDVLIQDGHLRATEEVLLELERKDDDVYEWAKQREDLFVPIDDPIQLAVQAILTDYPRIIDIRSNRSGADPFVIALAMVEGCSVLTYERPTRKPNRPHIPDVCDAMNVPCVNVVELIRREAWSF